MKSFKTTLGELRTGSIFPTWQDEFEIDDEAPVTVHEDGSVSLWEDGELLCGSFEDSQAEQPEGWGNLEWEDC